MLHKKWLKNSGYLLFLLRINGILTMGVIFSSGIFMSCFIILLLLTKGNKVLSDKILTVWIAIIAIHFTLLVVRLIKSHGSLR